MLESLASQLMVTPCNVVLTRYYKDFYCHNLPVQANKVATEVRILLHNKPVKVVCELIYKQLKIISNEKRKDLFYCL